MANGSTGPWRSSTAKAKLSEAEEIMEDYEDDRSAHYLSGSSPLSSKVVPQ